MASSSATVFSNKGLWWMIRWWLILTALALIVDWIFVFWVWKPNGVARLEALLQQDLGYTMDLGGVAGDATKFAMASANAFYALIFKSSGLHEMGYRFADPAPLNGPDTIARNFYIMGYEWIRVAMVGVQLFGVRLAILVQSLPVFLLAGIVAFQDGWWAGRYIRRAAAGRESAFLYHRAKHYVFVSLTMVWGVYLLLPFSVDPRLVIFPFVAVFAIAVRFWIAHFKKCL